MRIYDGKFELNSQEVQAFFEARGRSVDPAHPLTSVLYQTQNPQLAIERDAHEKDEVLPLLGLSGTSRVLDLGCGIGRWAEVLASQVAHYHGIDFSAGLIAEAQSRHAAAHVTFQSLAVEDVSPASLSIEGTFSHLLIAGVLLYMNDSQVERALKGALACAAKASMLYVREPIGIEHRLTLKDFWSEELGMTYNAIYRTRDELFELFEPVLASEGFRLRLERDLYPPRLNNRQDTIQRIFMFERHDG